MWKYSVIVFAGVLAYVVGSSLSPVALTVLAGVGIGVLASIPTAIAIAAIATPRTRSLPAPTYQYPTIIIVDPEQYSWHRTPELLPPPERKYLS